VTARILAGLRRHGNYILPFRADINEVVAALAWEARWVILPDGTTFPSSASAQVTSQLSPTSVEDGGSIVVTVILLTVQL
jgi:beta-amylase